MASRSNDTHLESGSVLCTKCRDSVLELKNKTSYLPSSERLRQVKHDWLLSPRMWPVGNLIGSPYSPLHVEQAYPQREWRDAFEDMLAVESGGEMISSESRQEERQQLVRSIRKEQLIALAKRMGSVQSFRSNGLCCSSVLRKLNARKMM